MNGVTRSLRGTTGIPHKDSFTPRRKLIAKEIALAGGCLYGFGVTTRGEFMHSFTG